MMTAILEFLADHIIGFMAFTMVFALLARFQAFRVSRRDRAYFFALTREILVSVEREKEQKHSIDNVDAYLSDLLGAVSKRIPNRKLRMQQREDAEKRGKSMSLDEYMGGKLGFLSNIQSESSVFHCQTPPNFTELTHRLLDQDENWNKLIGPVPIEGVSRLIDILPGLFVVFGVFGTFVGISLALPEIAQIDFSNVEASGKTLTRFVMNTTFAMKTSVVGIFCSLVLTMLNAVFPIKDVRGRIFKQVETTLQALWYHVQQARDGRSRLEPTLERLVAVLERMSTGREAPEAEEHRATPPPFKQTG
ncbi:hypothetical protein EB061_01750 [bacterium]|jgi:hypothetical protein|nr:hypothetical protein [bacterium]